MKALVTGAAGFIGSQLCERLMKAEVPTIGIDSFTDYYPRELKEANLIDVRRNQHFTFIEAGLAEVPVAGILAGVTHVFHLAAQAGVRKSWGQDFGIYTRNNVDATQVMLEGCIDRPIERFVFASSSSVYGDQVPLPMREDARPQPVSPYGVTKLAAEQLCYLYQVSYGIPTVSLRYFTVYGPRQRPDMGFHRFLLASMRDEPLPLFGDGRQTRDFTFVGDVVGATLAAATRARPGGVYNIGGGSRVEMLDVFELIRRITGRPLRIERLQAQRGDMRDTYADTTRARTDFGFAPSVTLEEGLRAQFEWMQKAGFFPA